MRNLVQYLIISLFLTVYIHPLNEEYSIRQLTDKDGLSQSTIFATIQDRQGYLWFATIDGLNRYDGYEFLVYSNNPEDSTSISDNFISALYEDDKGFIWAGTVNGFFNKFDPKTEKFKRYYVNDYLDVIEEPDPSYYEYPLALSRNQINSVTAITQDTLGYIWIGTFGNGIIRFDKKKETGQHIRKDLKDPEGLGSNRIMDLLVDKSGTLWVATFCDGINKLLRSDPGKKKFSFIKYVNRNNSDVCLDDDKVITLFEDRNENIWIGTYDGGLNLLDAKNKILNPGKAEFKKFEYNTSKNSLSSNIVTCIEQDFEGYIWIGTFGGGLNRLDVKSGKFEHFNKKENDQNSFSDNEILSLYTDRSGGLWVGSHLGEGVTLIKKRNSKFETLNSKSTDGIKLDDDVVWSVFRDSRDFLWVGTYKGGLNKIDFRNRSTKIFMHNSAQGNFISDNHIRSIAEDNFGNIWIGTYGGGLNRYNPKTGKIDVFRNQPGKRNSISANQVLDIYIESDSVIWIATYGGGINKLDFKKSTSSELKTIRVYENDPKDNTSLSDNRAYVIYIDSKKNFWVGTYGGGLNKFNESTGKFESYRYDPKNPHSISSDKVLSMLEDSKGNYWVGTSSGGLNKFNPNNKTFNSYSSFHGLTSAVVYGILEDNYFNLWFSTDDGIFMFNSETEKFTQFGLDDGVQSMEFSGGAYFKDKNDVLYFGGINGLNYFNPDSINIDSYLPPIVISSIKIFDEKIHGSQSELILSYKQNFISFEFASLDFSNPTQNQYAYKLEGFQNNWRYVGASMRIANYTNLPAGTYTFIVKGSNSDGIWNDEGTSIKLTINPPFWETWWFITLIVLLISFLIYYVSTIRIRNQLAIEKIKSNIASDLHDNIGAGLTEISILSEVANRKSKSRVNGDSKELINISETARQLVDSMSDIVWVVNPKRDSLYDLIIKLKDSYNEFLNSVGISFQVRNIDIASDVKLPMEYKQNLLLIFKEAINNSIKHSKCRKILLEALVNHERIEMSLIDDGIGFTIKEKGNGNGMKNMSNRAHKLNGEFEIQSAKDIGTTIRFKGKLSRLRKIKSLIKGDY